MRHRSGYAAGLLAAALLVTGCNSSGKGSATTGAPPPPANSAPTISMTSQSVLVGRQLSAQPTASDPDGQALTFSIQNAPSWLSFNSQTGAISGTPASSDVGTFLGITITVSDGQAQASATFSITVTDSTSGSATLTWQAPSMRTDGSPLTDLAGFRIYYGTSSGDLRYTIDVTDPGARNYVVDNLTPGTWYFSISAKDSTGAESARSNPASTSIS